MNKEPHNIEAETSVLASILINAHNLDRALDVIEVEDFYDKDFSKMFEIMIELKEEKKPIDVITLADRLNKYKQDVNWVNRLSGILADLSNENNFSEYLVIIKEKSLNRQLRMLGKRTMQNSEEEMDSGDIIEEAEKDMKEVQKRIKPRKMALLRDILIDNWNKVEDGYTSSSVLKGQKTGFRSLDKLTSGFQNGDLIVLGARPSMGKALKLDAKILTNNGWVLNKDLKINDKIISIDGTETNVVGIYPQGNQQCYKITFIDGREIECSEEHLWQVYSSKFLNKTRVLTTLQLFEKLQKVRYQNRISIPYFSGSYGQSKEMLIHPYLLGVLIGDGSLTNGTRWCKPDLDIVNKISTLIPDTLCIGSHKESSVFSIKRRKYIGKNPITQELKRIGLLGTRSYEKFIPNEYKHLCREQRLELLNGLLDTDGSVSEGSKIEFTTCSEQLSIDVQELVWSLGFRCSRNQGVAMFNGKRYRDRYRLHISGTDYMQLFSSPVKKDKLQTGKQILPLTIKSIVKTTIQNTQCIRVDHPSHLFITDNYLVTHNSALSLQFAIHIAKTSQKGVAMFMLEMSNIQTLDRAIAMTSGVDLWKMKTGMLEYQDYVELGNAYKFIYNSKLAIDDSFSTKLNDIKTKCKQLQRSVGLSMVVVDYLQLLESKKSKDSSNRTQEVSELSRGLKGIAKELNVPVLALSQLSRGVEQRPNKRPLMSDLRESGGVEQDSDIIMFLYKDSYYKTQEEKEKMTEDEEVVELNIAKHRNGELGTILLHFDKKNVSFRDK